MEMHGHSRGSPKSSITLHISFFLYESNSRIDYNYYSIQTRFFINSDEKYFNLTGSKVKIIYIKSAYHKP